MYKKRNCKKNKKFYIAIFRENKGFPRFLKKSEQKGIAILKISTYNESVRIVGGYVDD